MSGGRSHAGQLLSCKCRSAEFDPALKPVEDGSRFRTFQLRFGQGVLKIFGNVNVTGEKDCLMPASAFRAAFPIHFTLANWATALLLHGALPHRDPCEAHREVQPSRESRSVRIQRNALRFPKGCDSAHPSPRFLLCRRLKDEVPLQRETRPMPTPTPLPTCTGFRECTSCGKGHRHGCRPPGRVRDGQRRRTQPRAMPDAEWSMPNEPPQPHHVPLGLDREELSQQNRSFCWKEISKQINDKHPCQNSSLDFRWKPNYLRGRPQGCSSVGRASVSKTEGRGFESLRPCHARCVGCLYPKDAALSGRLSVSLIRPRF